MDLHYSHLNKKLDGLQDKKNKGERPEIDTTIKNNNFTEEKKN